MEKSSIIIVEGPQGVGKTTVTNFIRDRLASSNLYRLHGIPDKTIAGKEKNRKMYLELVNYMEGLEGTGLHLVFDRTFFSEEVYCRLGYKEYTFDDIYERLIKKLDSLNYDIYFVVLYLKDTEIFKTRLKREHHQYHEFSIQSSIDQQNEYLRLADGLKKTNIHVIKVPMDNFDKGIQKVVNKIPVLKSSIEK